MNREQELLNEFLGDLKESIKNPIFTIVPSDGVFYNYAINRPLWYDKIEVALTIWLHEKHPELFNK